MTHSTHRKTAMRMIVISMVWSCAASALADGDGEVRVFCSNGIRHVMEILRPAAERNIGTPISIRFGASAVLRRAIDQGEPFDVAVLTPQIIAELVEGHKIAAGSSVTIAQVNLGAGIHAGQPKTDISTADGIKRRFLAARSVTYAKEGAATPAIAAMFQRLGIVDEMQSRIVLQTVSGRPAESVGEGQNEIVLAPVSEILNVKGVKVLGLFPPEFQQPIVMTAAVSAASRTATAAKALIAFLASGAATAVMQANGVDPTPARRP